MKRTLLTAAAVVTLFFGAATAGAIPPETGSSSFVFDGCEDFGFALYDCGEFFLCEAGLIGVDWKLFFDNNGDPKKYREKVKFDGYVYGGDPDNRVDYNTLSYTYTENIVTGEEIYTGLFAMITVPGLGQIVRDVGRIVFDVDGEIVFEAGEHEYWNPEWDAVCELLETVISLYVLQAEILAANDRGRT